jgi:hypothetical protein
MQFTLSKKFMDENLKLSKYLALRYVAKYIQLPTYLAYLKHVLVMIFKPKMDRSLVIIMLKPNPI